MVRCEEFYKYFEKKGNFCNKSENVVKKVEAYIDYVKSHKIGGYQISNCALDPLINIENMRDGKVHSLALKELKTLIKSRKVSPNKITRRFVIELINRTNEKVEDSHKLDHIPNVRSKMGGLEHEIGELGYEVRTMFDDFKESIGIKNNHEVMKIMLELCHRNIDKVRGLIEENERMKENEGKVEIVDSTCVKCGTKI